MGYEVHITRRENWWDDETSKDITLAEWTEYIAKDSEMRLDNSAKANFSDGTTLKTEEDGIAVWCNYSLNGKEGNYAWFSYYNGEILVKNPDTEILDKMARIAKSLKAKVQGDDGELY